MHINVVILVCTKKSSCPEWLTQKSRKLKQQPPLSYKKLGGNKESTGILYIFEELGEWES